MVVELLDRGADEEIDFSANGVCALSAAVAGRHLDIVQLLHRRGASLACPGLMKV